MAKGIFPEKWNEPMTRRETIKFSACVFAVLFVVAFTAAQMSRSDAPVVAYEDMTPEQQEAVRCGHVPGLTVNPCAADPVISWLSAFWQKHFR